ncbi:Phosphatidylserine decarboxylase proenzyme [Sulfurimonas gotlandica GD1]|jgi:phosphatidylserine decarboxylase|uniref:phosphatidylserine decarboxylase n=1 Tax=Sulfurimonas gotlandica (strain DSM 19862 / JCM 16533 / GD1) TaxID=929558 RepID=B6BJQ0_SULGG|nr:phosphatidylserine decarboxylase [Sulfurimonas gotlandica]EDZ62601.1 phosphatidylserine decarboxylase [Sulfurimonas gotlandica GD1]EHP31297.1 Phosphatidylserine decarboxylase proenzyme [Sulfurimonas gotlandica GD1]
MSRHITSAISQNFGKFANKEFPKWFQKIVNSSYVGLMGLNMNEFHAPGTYKSLNALFTRKLKEDRKYSLDADDFISPCDSLISECGELKEDYALQIKGMKYSSDELLGNHFSSDEKKAIHDGNFINFYLSPKDYHRFHIPTNLKVLRAVHIPGKLYPVNFPSLRKRLNLFIENERVVLMCENASGKKFYMVLVGALNVGVMQVSFEPNIKTNADVLIPTVYEYEDLYLNKGDDFGCFEMGSTIVILSQKGMLEFEDLAGKDVKYGENIAKNV